MEGKRWGVRVTYTVTHVVLMNSLLDAELERDYSRQEGVEAEVVSSLPDGSWAVHT